MKLLANYLIGSLNDIHNQLYSESIYSFEKNTNHLKSSFSNGVLPLQNYINVSYQVSHSELSEVSEVGPCLHYSNSHSLAGTQFDTNSWGLKDLASYMDNRQSLVCNDGNCSADGYLSNRRMYQAYLDKRIVNGESSFQGLHDLIQISSQVQEEAEANVHLGAPPPWFDATEENPLNVRPKSRLGRSNLASSCDKEVPIVSKTDGSCLGREEKDRDGEERRDCHQ